MPTRRKKNKIPKKNSRALKKTKGQTTNNPQSSSESLFRNLVYAVPTAIFIYQRHRNRLINPAAEALTGYSSEELLAKDFWDIVHPDFREVVKKRGLARQQGKHVAPRYEVKILTKSGEERWLDFSGGLIEFEGQPGVVGTAIDITERKRIEEEIRRQRQRQLALHEVNAAITTTLDLRTVLELLLKKIDLLLPYAAATVRLFNRETGTLDPAACRNIREENWKSERWQVGRGLTKLVFESKSPLFVRNVQSDPRAWQQELLRREGLVSYLGVPLIVKEEPLGVLSFYTKEEYDFQQDEIEFLTALAGQAAVAIHNSQLYDEVQKGKDRLNEAHSQLSALYDVTTIASQSLELDKLLNGVIQKVREIFHFDVTRIYLFDSQMENLVLHASYETSPDAFAHIRFFRRGEGIIGRVVESGAPMMFEDIVKEPQVDELNTTGNLKKAGLRFFGVFPIKSKLRIVGAISLGCEKVRALTSGEIQLLLSMAGQIGIAVENATLFQQTAARARELSALYSVAGIAAQILDVHTLLRNAMHKILEIFRFHAARIYLLDSDRKEISLVAQEGLSEDVMTPRTYRIGEGLVGSVLKTGEPLVFEDMQNDPEYLRRAVKRVILQAGFRSTFFIPIKVRGETLGVVNLLSKEVHSFSPSDIQLINSIAYHLGIAVGNANLFFQLKQKTLDLEKANRAKDEFLSVISHELRTPLNVIMGFAGMIHDRILGELNSEQEGALEKVMSHTKDLLSVVNSMLQVASLQTGTVDAEYRELSLGDFCDTLNYAYSAPLDKSLSLRWDYPRDLPVVKTDSGKLKQIIQNLIENAIKFTEEGDVVISVRYLAKDQTVEFEIADSGVGIPKQMIPTIFEMFRQADSSETRPFGGMGLGLYVAKRYTEILGGQIQVKSEPGKGSTFTAKIPCEALSP